MFPEYRDLITQLKQCDPHFTRLFNRHNELDHAIKHIEIHVPGYNDLEVETMKKEKLRIKDELHVLLKKAAAPV
ncbi:YdcH family protein [Silvimonas amylolytica]|uniref:DUF465 domain-containing protein n=1 Tax=Silvimonas amylolytica TaxID=449663 RepID=A0ABQ2PSA9_9NEIS|nr:YdcH family protein [Silvimonas amylolytica]GGP28188.1 hypothetical protein GCM10010971_40070 [Silvimonas amylolytica]